MVPMLAAGVWGCAATAMSSVGEAEVTASRGQPCFSLHRVRAGKDAPFRIHSLSVTRDESSGQSEGSRDWRSPPPEMWGFVAPWPGLLRDGATGCIRYGSLPASSENHGGGAAPLQPGRLYEVTISAGPADGDGPAIGYRARFCIAAASGGSSEVRNVLWDDKAQRWRDDVCSAR